MLLISKVHCPESNEAYDMLSSSDFHTEGHGKIFKCCKEENRIRGHATLLGVTESMASDGSLGAAGADSYIRHLEKKGRESTAHPNEAAHWVKQHARGRRIANAARKALEAANQEGVNVSLATAESLARKLLKSFEEPDSKKYGQSALSGIIEGARTAFAPPIKTGWWHLDKQVKFSPGRLIVLGARPGIGKTTVATQLSTQILRDNKKGRILYCSVEMEPAEIGLKALSCLTGIDCIRGFEKADEEEIVAILSRAGQYGYILDNLHIYYTTRLDRLLHLAHQLSKDDKQPLKLVVVDFITSLQPIGEHATRAEAVGSISRELKSLAKDLSIPVLACAQLNRGTAPGKRPSMKDLRDSGQIEQDADVVMLLHRPVDDNGTPGDITELLIDKNRFGKMDILQLYPDLEVHRFRIPDPKY